MQVPSAAVTWISTPSGVVTGAPVVTPSMGVTTTSLMDAVLGSTVRVTVPTPATLSVTEPPVVETWVCAPDWVDVDGVDVRWGGGARRVALGERRRGEASDGERRSEHDGRDAATKHGVPPGERVWVVWVGCRGQDAHPDGLSVDDTPEATPEDW